MWVPAPASRSYVLARSRSLRALHLDPGSGTNGQIGGRRAQGAVRRHRRPRWGCHRSGVRDTAPSAGSGDTGKRTTVTGPDRAAQRASSLRRCAARRRRRAGELSMATVLHLQVLDDHPPNCHSASSHWWNQGPGPTAAGRRCRDLSRSPRRGTSVAGVHLFAGLRPRQRCRIEWCRSRRRALRCLKQWRRPPGPFPGASSSLIRPATKTGC